MKKHILFIAGEFPPYKTIGRIRTVKWCAHLSRIGWRTSVLTLPYEETIAGFDRRTLDEVPPQTAIHRASWPRPKDFMVSTAKSILKTNKKNQADNNTNQTIKNTANQNTPGFSIGSLMGMIDRFSRYYLLIPDDYLLWSIPAIYRGLKIVQQTRPDIIFATAPPFSGLMVGSILSRITGIPWVADYRDLWTGDVLREWVPGWRQKLEIQMEKIFLKNAAAVLTVSEPKTKVMQDRLVSLPDHRFHTITNGFDSEEYNKIPPLGRLQGKIRLVYTGRLFKNRRGYELINALGIFCQKWPAKKEVLQIEYYGGVSQEIMAKMDSLISEYSLQENVIFHPDIPYSKSKAVQKGADVLLLIVDTGKTTSGVLPGKLFEYMAAGRPVLCLAEEGAASEIVAEGNLGWHFKPGDVDSVVDFYEMLCNLSCEGIQANFKSEYLARFDRKFIADRLSELLEHI